MVICFVFSAATSSVSCAQQQDSTVYRYESQDREQTREAMRETARELGQMTRDFRNFYTDLKQAVDESGLYDTWGGGPTGFGSVDVEVKDENMIVVMDLPGVEKEDLSVRLRDAEVLEVEGKRNAYPVEQKEKGGSGYYRQDRYRGTFSRSVELPYKAAPGKEFKAEYRNGILTVVIPMEKPPAAEIVEIPVS